MQDDRVTFTPILMPHPQLVYAYQLFPSNRPFE